MRICNKCYNKRLNCFRDNIGICHQWFLIHQLYFDYVKHTERLTELENEMTSVQMEQSESDAKCSSLDEAKVKIETRLTAIEGM